MVGVVDQARQGQETDRDFDANETEPAGTALVLKESHPASIVCNRASCTPHGDNIAHVNSMTCTVRTYARPCRTSRKILQRVDGDGP